MSETTINERIKAMMDYFGLNQRQFSMRCGLDPTVIYNIIGSRMNKPSFDVLQKILFTFTNINIEWLILGVGEMVKNDKVNGKVYGKVMEENAPEYGVLNKNEREKELEKQVEYYRGKVEALMAVIKELSNTNTAMEAPKKGSKSA